MSALGELIQEHREFIGENMIIVDIVPSSNMVVIPPMLMNKSNVINIPCPLTV